MYNYKKNCECQKFLAIACVFRVPNLEEKKSLFLTVTAKTSGLLNSGTVILSLLSPPPLVLILVHYFPANKKPSTALSVSKMCILTYQL